MSTYYRAVLNKNGPFFLRRDDNDRIEIVANYHVDGKIASAFLLAEIGNYLVANGIGTALDTDVFLGKLPPTPDVITSIIHYGGAADEPDLGTGLIRLEFPEFQVVCRGIRDDYATPMVTATAVKVALTKIQNQSL